MEVSTTKYQWVHGRKPRGYGHWAFVFDNDTDNLKFFTGKYAVAKDTATRYAVTKGHTKIEVGV